MFVTNNNKSQSIQFDTKNQIDKKKNWTNFYSDWKAGKFNYDDLSEDEKEYIKLHDPIYAQMFL